MCNTENAVNILKVCCGYRLLLFLSPCVTALLILWLTMTEVTAGQCCDNWDCPVNVTGLWSALTFAEWSQAAGVSLSKTQSLFLVIKQFEYITRPVRRRQHHWNCSTPQPRFHITVTGLQICFHTDELLPSFGHFITEMTFLNQSENPAIFLSPSFFIDCI